MNDLFAAFLFEGELIDIKPFGNGHINDTYKVTTTANQYIIQRINHYVFKQPEVLMDNYRKVTDYLKAKVNDPLRETLTIIQTKDNKDYYKTAEGNYYRAILFIDHAYSKETIDNVHSFYQTGVAFGNFSLLLQDFPIDTIKESIPDFHNTPKRYKTFLESLDKASSKRKQEAAKEIQFIINHQNLSHALYDMQLPLRVTHNDTKLNNILFDSNTNKPLCVIDLDTIMPGFIAYDFGDCIRTGATYAKEDETDLDKVTLDLELYEALLKGYLEGTHHCLTDKEVTSLPAGALTITYEQAIRFLTDYLDGDVYYKTEYENHNLIRTRTQIKLVEELLKNQNVISQLLYKYKG